MSLLIDCHLMPSKTLHKLPWSEALFCFAGLGEIPDFILGQPLLEAGNICTRAVVQV